MNSPNIVGADPKEKESQNKIFKIKYIRAINKHMKLETNPNNVINLRGALECFTIPSKAKSYRVKILFFVDPCLLLKF